MPQGVSIEAHPVYYEDAIERHGQYSRWYQSLPCWCINQDGYAEPKCYYCSGRGRIFSPFTVRRRVEKVFSFGGVEINTTYKIRAIHKVWTGDGTALTVSSFTGTTITLDSSLPRGAYATVDYDQDLLSVFTVAGVWEGRGVIRASLAPILTDEGTFTGQIIELTSVRNTTQDEGMEVVAFWEDRILTSDIPEDGDEIEVKGTTVDPVKMLVTDLTQKQRLETMGNLQDAEASMTFPGYLPVGSGDMITLLKASQRSSGVGTSKSNVYQLPYFHIDELIEVRDEIGTLTGCQIVRNNQLQFTERKPEGRFSYNLAYHPSFSIINSLPSLRYGGDKVFPKRVYLKRYDMMSPGMKQLKSVEKDGFEETF